MSPLIPLGDDPAGLRRTFALSTLRRRSPIGIAA